MKPCIRRDHSELASVISWKLLPPGAKPCSSRARPWHDRVQRLLTGGQVEHRPMISNTYLKGRTAHQVRHKEMRNLRAVMQPVPPPSSSGPRKHRRLRPFTAGSCQQAISAQAQRRPEALSSKLPWIPSCLLPSTRPSKNLSQLSLGISSSYSQTSLTSSFDRVESLRRPMSSHNLQLSRLEEAEKEAEEQSKRERLQSLKEYQSEWRQKHIALQRRKTAAVVSSRMRALQRAMAKEAKQALLDRQVSMKEAEQREDENQIVGALSNFLGKRGSAEPEPPSASLLRGQTSKHLTGSSRAPSQTSARMHPREDSKEHADIISNTETGGVPARRNGRGKTGTFEMALIMSKKHALPLKVVRARLAEFKEFDEDGNNLLTMSEFEQAIKKHCKIDTDQQLPEQIRAANLACADKDKDGSVDFEEYLLWSLQTNFVEELLVPDPSDREFRQTIRDYNLNPFDVDKIRAVFTSCDFDGAGEIEWEEFKALLCKLMNVRSDTDIPAPELRRRWREADINNQGKITFETFVVWYAKAGYFEKR
eukprot:TRINITY_DN11511_c0_g1_i1.p1 TRINITY_DN11511_c0_g1~~TRINITY_DN11511_c0_g1_i1.p1  ORF type:complete len:536 (-),score=109.69 TRINITY_DN11511_c0_g1_i1:189-1796(-)